MPSVTARSDRRDLVTALCDHLGLDSRTPTDPYDIAARHSVRVEQEAHLGQAGLYQPAERVIRIDSGAHPTRRRFTLAHELGHHFITTTGLLTTDQQRTPEVERACDRFAADLLMPAIWTASMLDGQAVGLDSLAVLRNAAGVSWSAALRAANDHVPAWKHALLEWRWDGTDEVWYRMGSTAVPRATPFAENAATWECLDAGRGCGFARTWLPAQRGNRSVRFRVFLHSSSTAVVRVLMARQALR